MNNFNLTPRELEVLQMRAFFGPTKNVAIAMNLSSGTVSNYMQSIIKKMDAKNITHAVAMAWHYGMIV